MALPPPSGSSHRSLPSVGSKNPQPVTLSQNLVAGVSSSLSTLTTERARSCVRDLDSAILRIRDELRLSANTNPSIVGHSQKVARAVTEAVNGLAEGVTELEHSLNNAQSGLAAAIRRTLASHFGLMQIARDSFVIPAVLRVLSDHISGISEASRLAADGCVPEAALNCLALSEWCLQEGQTSLASRTLLWSDLMVRMRAIQESTQAQLVAGYRRAVHIHESEAQLTLTVRGSTEFPEHGTSYDLTAVVSAMSESTMSEVSTHFRKELLVKIIEPVLSGSATVGVDDDHIKLDFRDGLHLPTLKSLSIVLKFLQDSLPERLMKSLRLHLSSTMLARVLIPATPQRVSGLREYLVLVQGAVDLEEQMACEVTVQRWAEDVGTHYEKSRRKAVLAQARSLLLDDRVCHEIVQIDVAESDMSPVPTYEDEGDSGWDFDANSSAISGASDRTVSSETIEAHAVTRSTSHGHATDFTRLNGEDEEDDPWDDVDVGSSSSPGLPGDTPMIDPGPRGHLAPQGSASPRPSCSISRRAQGLLQIIVDILKESSDLLLHNDLFVRNSATGSVLYSVPAVTLDLFRALPPSDVAAPRFVLLFNDCSYLARKLDTQSQTIPTEFRAKLSIALEKLYSMGKDSLVLAIKEHIKLVKLSLSRAKGFSGMANEERALVCESAIEATLRHCDTVGREWQLLLSFETYARSMGAVVEVVLTDVLDSILHLLDITESESGRLNRLCIRLKTVENLFVRIPEEDSEIASYVPCWFKFNYLSALLEGTLVDITDLYREGHLVDFRPQEIVSLVKALFADTSLRARTIDLLLSGPS